MLLGILSFPVLLGILYFPVLINILGFLCCSAHTVIRHSVLLSILCSYYYSAYTWFVYYLVSSYYLLT